MQVEETAAAANPGATYPFSGAAGQALFFDGSTSLFLSLSLSYNKILFRLENGA